MSLEKFIEYLDIEKNYSKHTVIAYKTDLINFQDFLIDSNYKVEIESARKETYPIPGENQIVELSTIKKDLIRRDFNINAMAIELKDNRLIDLFSGSDAIENMKMDFLHKSSVLEAN